MKKEILEFVKSNNIVLTETQSSLNSQCCILAGFSLYNDIENSDDVIEILKEEYKELNSEFITEFERVFEYAKAHNYGDFWTSDAAKKMYVY